jgi:hypothetical protein
MRMCQRHESRSSKSPLQDGRTNVGSVARNVRSDTGSELVRNGLMIQKVTDCRYDYLTVDIGTIHDSSV